MLQLDEHKVNPANDTLTIKVVDEEGTGGANHLYVVPGFDIMANQSHKYIDGIKPNSLEILFRNGPINEVGVNGVTQEVLLAIAADRLRSFQKRAICLQSKCLCFDSHRRSTTLVAAAHY